MISPASQEMFEKLRTAIKINVVWKVVHVAFLQNIDCYLSFLYECLSFTDQTKSTTC